MPRPSGVQQPKRTCALQQTAVDLILLCQNDISLSLLTATSGRAIDDLEARQFHGIEPSRRSNQRLIGAGTFQVQEQ